jgi:hypothetical protein
VEVAITVLVCAGVVGLLVRLSAAETKKREALLGEVARRLGAAFAPRQMTMTGARDGHPVVFRLTYHGSGKHKQAFTEIDVPLPRTDLSVDASIARPAAPSSRPPAQRARLRPLQTGPSALFSFELRRQGPMDESRVRRGLAVDVQTGDAAFDGMFVVEAAPADVARALLTPDLRRELVALKPHKVRQVDGQLRVERFLHVTSPDEAIALVDLAARLAAGVRPAHAAADSALEAAAPREGAPFRAEPDASAIQEKKAARAGEVAALAQVKERRAAREKLVAVAAVAALVLAVLLLSLR